MEEEILVKGEKNFHIYLTTMFLLLFALSVFVFIIFCFIKCIDSMFDFLIYCFSFLVSIIILLIIYKVTQSYISEEIYLTNTKFVLKRGKKTLEFPLENVIKLRCANDNLTSIISIRTRNVKKYLIFNMENSTEIYNKYINARKKLDLPPEHDRENPIWFVLVMLVLFSVISMSLFQDYLENIPAPSFITQEHFDD